MSRRLSAQLGVLALTIWIYWPVHGFGFVTWDDGVYVSQNPHVAAGLTAETIRWAFTTQAPYWQPLTWLSHALDVDLFGMNAGAHHLANLVWHLLNTTILSVVLARLTARPWCAIVTAAMFAVHPLHVESVAWIAERKDLLSACFALLTVGAYARYVRAPSPARMAVVLVCVIASLLAKPMFVTMPIWLLLLDVWPLARPLTRQRLTEKLPLVVPAALVAVVASLGQWQTGTMATLARLSIGERLANAAVAYATYLRKAIWPSDLAAYYPYPSGGHDSWQVMAAVMVLAAISGLAFAARRRRYVPVGWLWYVVLLLPVIGLVQVGNQAFADRFTYIPLVGVTIAIVWGVADLARSSNVARTAAAAVAAAAILAFAGVARAQVMTWATSETMWSRVLAITPSSYEAQSALGAELADRGDLEGARRHQEEALRLRPDDPDANNEMGMLLARAGDYTAAIAHFERALASRRQFDEARKNLARAHFDRGNGLAKSGAPPADTLPDFRAAVTGDDSRADHRAALGLTLLAAGQRLEAIAELRAALALDPSNDRLRQLLAQIDR